MLLYPQRSPSALTDEILTLNITHNLPTPWLSYLYPWGIPTGHGHGVWPPEIPQILSWRGAVRGQRQGSSSTTSSYPAMLSSLTLSRWA